MLAVEAVGDADPITIVEHLGTGRLAIPMLIVLIEWWGDTQCSPRDEL